jgi:hypothetical protein
LPPPSGLAPSEATADSGATVRRYTTTWVNVRAGRSNTAPVIRILRPRQMVLVGSLEQGWYRVMNDRQAPGFVDGRYLNAVPPAVPP